MPTVRIEELDWSRTELGELLLRRRIDPVLGEVYEVRLGDEYLMSSMFTAAEESLARLALARAHGTRLRVLVGGLGLGYTARAALEDGRVTDLVVVEKLAPVIEWHLARLLPTAPALVDDDRTTLHLGDFFAMAAAAELPRAGGGTTPYDAVLLDVDHTPSHLLAAAHAPFYSTEGLTRLAAQMTADAVFGLWSDDPPDETFLDVLGTVFSNVRGEVVEFANPLTGGSSRSTVYLGSRG